MDQSPVSSCKGYEHEDYRIALFYLYVDLASANNVKQHVDFHRSLCEQLNLGGRIRISGEGINGVLGGLHQNLLSYQAQVTNELERISVGGGPLDVKYCLLREDLSIESQLFDSLIVKETKTVISLFNDEKISKKAYRRRKKEASQQQGKRDLAAELLAKAPSTHLTASEWNDKLEEASSSEKALLLDVRNVYESRVGYFSAPQVPTLLTNTRKYSCLLYTSPSPRD